MTPRCEECHRELIADVDGDYLCHDCREIRDAERAQREKEESARLLAKRDARRAKLDAELARQSRWRAKEDARLAPPKVGPQPRHVLTYTLGGWVCTCGRHGPMSAARRVSRPIQRRPKGFTKEDTYDGTWQGVCEETTYEAHECPARAADLAAWKERKRMSVVADVFHELIRREALPPFPTLSQASGPAVQAWFHTARDYLRDPGPIGELVRSCVARDRMWSGHELDKAAEAHRRWAAELRDRGEKYELPQSRYLYGATTAEQELAVVATNARRGLWGVVLAETGLY